MIIYLAWCCALVLPATEQPPDWCTPLPVDPMVHRGRLPNGLTYWIRRHPLPPDRVGIWLHIASGSLNEEDSQRGFAHLIEHMALKGTTHFPPGTLVKYFESIGLSPGYDQNAFTRFNQTTYTLCLPNVQPETMRKGLQCLADFAFGQMLVHEEIQQERRVVLEEFRSRSGREQRFLDRMLPFVLPGSRLAERLPIGQENIIRNADRGQLLSYYRQWYRPEFATVLLVGDIEPPTAERLLTEAFHAWSVDGTTPSHTDPCIKPLSTLRAAVFTDPESVLARWTVLRIAQLQEERTLGDYRHRLAEKLGCWIVNRRLSNLLWRGQPPFQSAQCGVSTWFDACTIFSAGATGDAEHWKPMLVSLLTELKRANVHGFDRQELDNAKRAVIAEAGQNVRAEPTWDLRCTLDRLNGLVSRNQLPMSESQRAHCLLRTLPWIELDNVNKAFRANFATENLALLLEMPKSAHAVVPTESDLLALARETNATPAAPSVLKERTPPLPVTTPGRAMVQHDEFDEYLEVYSAWFQNNVRIHVREMNFGQSQVWVRIALAGGRLHETASSRGLSDAAALAFRRPATHGFDSIQIDDSLIGRNVSLTGWAEDDALVLQMSCAPEDLETGFQLARLLLLDAHVEETAFNSWRKQAKDDWLERQYSVEARLVDRLNALRGDGDPRFLSCTPEALNRLTPEAVQVFLDRHLKEAPIEVAMVGDVSQSQATELARKYLGTLPKRSRHDSRLDKLRKLSLPNGPRTEAVEVNTITDRAILAVGWRGPDRRDTHVCRRLLMASQILQSRLYAEVREKRGLTYSISASLCPAEVYPGTGFFGAHSSADPRRATETLDSMQEVLESLRERGPTEEEVACARKQLDNQIGVQFRDPDYWLALLSSLDRRNAKLSAIASARERAQTTTRDEVHQVLLTCLKPAVALRVIAMPRSIANGTTEDPQNSKRDAEKYAIRARSD